MTRYKKTMSEAYREVYNLSEKMSSSQIAKLKKAYEPMRGKKISSSNAEKLMKIMDMVDKDKNVLIQLFKADIPFVSELAVTRLITKHKMKGAEINKLKSEALDKEDEPKVKEIIKKLKGASQAHAGQAKDLEKAVNEEDGHFMYKDGEKVMVKTKADHDKYAKMGYTMDEAMLNLSTVKFQAKDALGKIRHKVTQKGKKYIVSVDSNDEEDAQKAMKDHPLYVAGKLRVVPEEVELDEKYDLYHKTFSGAMQHAYDYAKKKMGITVDPKEIDSKVATGPRKPSEGKTNTYRLKGRGGNLQIQVYNKGGSKPFELNMYKESVELDEKVEYVEYKFRNKNDAMKAKKMLDAVQLMGFEINDDNISNGELMVDAGNKDMTKYHKEIMKKFKPKVMTQESLDESKEALKKKAEKSGVSVGILSKVYDRGMAAWKTGHRPGTTPQQWALARVNSFLTGGGARKADNDLWKKAKKEEVELDEAKEVLSRFRDDKLKQSVMNLAKQKGLKVKDMGDKIEVSGNGRKVMDLTLAVQKQDVKINEDAVKSAQMKLDKAKKIQDLKDKIKDIRDEGARADAMRAMRTKRGVDPADIDTDATDDDMKAASKNIIMQLRKSVSLGKNFKVEFGDKKKMAVDPKIAQAVMNKYMSFRKPMDKEKFQSKIAKSYKDMLRAMKESIHEEEEKPDNTKFTDRIKKAQERLKNATKGTQEHSDAIDALKNAKDAYAEYKKKSAGKLKRAGAKLKSGLKKTATGLKKTAIATGIGAIATAKLGDSYDPKIKREAILDRIDKKLEEKKNG